MKTKFKLGQAVEITGRYVQKFIPEVSVDKAEVRIKASGQPEISQKYSIAKFDLPKEGVIVGIRNIASDRIHYIEPLFGGIMTKTKRQPAYLVATDMRGLVYVPIEMVKEVPKVEPPFEILVDFDDVRISDDVFEKLDVDRIAPYLAGDKLRLIPGLPQ